MTSLQEALKAIVPVDQGVICPYCDKTSKKVKGDVIYPHRKDLADKDFYLCTPCDAYVGCHDKTGKPLGRLANSELRELKMAAHRAFDPMWQSGLMTRSDAYAWLTQKLKVHLKGKPAHIGEFDPDLCRLVIRFCNDRREYM